MGNVVLMKIPAVGGLAHVLTMEAYATELPPGVLQFVSGRGREVVPPIMESGKVRPRERREERHWRKGCSESKIRQLFDGLDSPDDRGRACV